MEKKIVRMVQMKKIIKIKKGEYLLAIANNSVATTYKIDSALDISKWSLETLGFIVGNLKKVGYNRCEVLTIEDENDDKDPAVKIDSDEK